MDSCILISYREEYLRVHGLIYIYEPSLKGNPKLPTEVILSCHYRCLCFKTVLTRLNLKEDKWKPAFEGAYEYRFNSPLVLPMKNLSPKLQVKYKREKETLRKFKVNVHNEVNIYNDDRSEIKDCAEGLIEKANRHLREANIVLNNASKLEDNLSTWSNRTLTAEDPMEKKIHSNLLYDIKRINQVSTYLNARIESFKKENKRFVKTVFDEDWDCVTLIHMANLFTENTDEFKAHVETCQALINKLDPRLPPSQKVKNCR